MRFAVEAWSPDYGAPLDDGAFVEATVDVDAAVEVPLDRWAPRPVVAEPFDDVLFVDGVRRVEATVWITEGDDVHQGLCASYAAGAVRCDGAARLEAAEVRRAVLTTAAGAADIDTVHGRFTLAVSASDDVADLSLALQRKMGELEGAVAARSGGVGLVVTDGPLRSGLDALGAAGTPVVGYIKTHRTAYGPLAVRQAITALGVGERTPLLVVDSPRGARASWYLRLPCQVTHGWAGVVRLETTTDRPVEALAALADQVSATLPAYASAPTKDPRAPQNLYPIGGLERELRRRLGDATVMQRALRSAAAASA